MTPLIKFNRNYPEKLQRCLVFYVGVLLCMYKAEGISEGAKCGRPGRTALNTYEPSPRSEFNENEVIRYKCTEKDHVILGASGRQCQKNGTWSNEIPVCSKLVQFQGAEISQVGQAFDTFDGNISTCSEASSYGQTTWRGYLARSTKIRAVRISVVGIGEVEVDIDVIVQENNSLTVKRCNIKNERTEISTKSTKILTLYCPPETTGVFVDVSYTYRFLRICEVSVLLPPVSACLSPDIPLHGYGRTTTSVTESTYHFECHPGYKRWGPFVVTCQADGTWFPKSPICQKIFCRAPDKLENGYVQYDSNGETIPYNGTARYSCKEGFYLEGQSVIRCHRWDEWDFPAPVCKPRTLKDAENQQDVATVEILRQSNVSHCSNLPLVANGVFIANSSNTGSVARLKCSEGFKPLTDDHVSCLPTGEWSSQSLRCITIQCEANPVIPHGKAILLNNSSYYGAHLEIKCNYGYTSHTPITRNCNEFGTWGDLNICVEITCGTFNTKESSEGEWMSVNGSASIRVLICPEGFHIEGSPAVIRCLSNGSWSYTSAMCKTSFASLWGNNWTPSLMLIAAVAVGAGTAILILCLFAACVVVRKRRQSQTNTTVFHLENTSHKDETGQVNIQQQKHQSVTENYENVIERRSKSIGTNPRKPCSALPNLPLDADPVYAQPFETVIATKKMSNITANKKDDLYNTHIYAEPVDSRRQTPNHMPINMTSSRMGTEARLSATKTNFGNESSTSLPVDQQNCDKTCAIYDSSSNSTFNNGQLPTDGKFQRYNEKTEFGTLTKNLEYMELL